MEEPVAYRSYLLRIWPRQVDGHAGCAVTLESVTTGRRVTLPDVPSLVAYLNAPEEGEPGTSADGLTTSDARIAPQDRP